MVWFLQRGWLTKVNGNSRRDANKFGYRSFLITTFALINCSLQKNKMAIQTGQPTPDFSLYNTARAKVTLSDQHGAPVLLLFFPMAFSSVCTAELCATRDNIAFYNKTQATVFGISVDSL